MSRGRRSGSKLLGALLVSLMCAGGLLLGSFAFLVAGTEGAAACGFPSDPGLGPLPPGQGRMVGATEYGGPGDPASGVIGARGDNLLAHADSYAELGGVTWSTADALGGLPYMTALRITWGSRSVIAYKRDIGLGGGPVQGLPRALDLWWELAAKLGIPYEHGAWSGAVRIERLSAAGAGSVLGEQATAGGSSLMGCADAGAVGLELLPGQRAQLLVNGTAAAPNDAPAAVKAMIAAGNAIAGRPYVYGAGHGMALSELSPAYDCSSSVEHLLYGGGLISAHDTVASSALESFGVPGPGRWVTLYASSDHVFMYVAGLRWDTHNAAGVGDGSRGIGWHPLVRDASGFVERHPVGL